MSSTRTVTHNKISWVNLPEQSARALAELRARFGFLDSDIKEASPPFQCAKIVERPGYFFIILQFPVARETIRHHVRFTEVDVFLTPDTLVTVHDNELHSLRETFGQVAHDDDYRATLFGGGTTGIFLHLWKKLLEQSVLHVMNVNDDITNLDRKIFAKSPNKEIMEELMRLRTNIVTLRRALGPQRQLVDKFSVYGDKLLNAKKFTGVLRELKEATAEVWQLLDSQLESSHALHEAVESVVAVHTSDTMKIFTVISVITFPLTLLATLFAVRAGGTPLIDRPGGFWFLFWILLLGAGGMLHLFKKKGLM